MKLSHLVVTASSLLGCSGSVEPLSEYQGGDGLGTTGGAAPGGGGAASSGGSALAGGSTGVATGGAGTGGFGAGGSTGGSTGDDGMLGGLLSSAVWEELFPNRNPFFTYEAFVSAVGRYPGFASTGDDATRRRELAAFLANISHETNGGWADAPGGPYAWGLYFKEEVGCEGGCPGYSQGDAENPCAWGKSYHGRGPIQLSYCYNYGPAGRAIGVDLLATPELVSTDPVVAFETGLWFWMNGRSGGPTTSHGAMTSGQGFGATIRIINGIECNGGNPTKVQSRVGFFEHFAEILGVDPGGSLTC